MNELTAEYNYADLLSLYKKRLEELYRNFPPFNNLLNIRTKRLLPRADTKGIARVPVPNAALFGPYQYKNGNKII